MEWFPIQRDIAVKLWKSFFFSLILIFVNWKVSRREEEVRRRNEDLDDRRRKNRMVQDAVSQQIRTLQEKLDEYRVNHKAEEESIEDEISALEDTLSEVKITLEKRRTALELEMGTPSAPATSSGSASGDYSDNSTIPSSAPTDLYPQMSMVNRYIPASWVVGFTIVISPIHWWNYVDDNSTQLLKFNKFFLFFFSANSNSDY